MNKELIMRQAIALRASAAATFEQAESLMALIASEMKEKPSGECLHPEDKRIDTTTAGQGKRSFFCKSCGGSF